MLRAELFHAGRHNKAKSGFSPNCSENTPKNSTKRRCVVNFMIQVLSPGIHQQKADWSQR